MATGPLFVARTMAGNRAAAAPPALPLDWPPPKPWPTLARTNRPDYEPITDAARLACIVAWQVVPHLARADSAVADDAALPDNALSEFSARLLASDIGPARAFAAEAMQRGTSAASLYLNLFEPAARHLGDLWSIDRLAFADVTIGLVRLHQLLRAFGANFHAADIAPRADRHILLMAPAGAHHMFGVSMVRAFFQRAGWIVWNTPPATDDQLAATMRANRFDVIGFSVACTEQLPAIRASIRVVRRASQTRRVVVMVGGPACVGHPERAAELGADATAADAGDAVKQAERLLAVRAPRG